MGETHSIPLPRYGCCIRPQNPNRCKENHSQMPKAKGGHRRNLSATFSFPEAESFIGNDLLNINTATEEEFMTLPGINRQTAQNIVEYRRQIDGFRMVEDLALVSGVGATRLNHIRMELTVGKRGLSKNSSASSSGIDLSMHDNISRGSAGGSQNRPATKININTSNVFQLMKVRFVSQALAENIVSYRDRKGPFSSFNELLKVKGIRPEVLSAIQPHLVLEDDLSSTSADIAVPHSSPDKLEMNGVELRGLRDLVGPMSQVSLRNSIISKGTKNCVRVASWNLDNCSVEKMDNPGVREVIAMTILENGFGVVALQEVMDEKALEKLIDELSSPVLSNVKNWGSSRGNWKYIISSPFFCSTQTNCHLVFLYDASKGIELTNSGFAWTIPSSNSQNSVPLFLAEFKVESLEFMIANVYLNPPKLHDHDLSDALVQSVASLLCQYKKEGSRNLLLAGHFGMGPECKAMVSLNSTNFQALLSGDDFTDINSKDLRGSICTENMWTSHELKKLHSGKTEVIRNGLSNPWIPDGSWGWGGLASHHCPFFTEFFTKGAKSSDESSDELSSRATFIIADDS